MKTTENLRVRIENERIFLNHLAEDGLDSEKILKQSQFMDDLIADLYEKGADMGQI